MLLQDAPEILAALLVAVLLDRLLGEPEFLYRRVPHPVVLIGRLVTLLEARLLDPSEVATQQRLAGAFLVLAVVGPAFLVGHLLVRLVGDLPLGWMLEGAAMGTLLAWRSLADHVGAVADGLDRGLAQGRRAVAKIVGRDPERLDDHAVARAGIESLAENLSDAVLAPLFWGLLLGLPGMLAYKAVNTLDSMVGYRDARYRHFGWASARLDDLVNLVPARVTATAIVLAAFLVRDARPAWGLRAMRRDAPRHRSPNAGWPEAALAGALGLRLAGPRSYAGRPVEDAWMGSGRAEATPADVRRALRLAGRAYGLVVLLLLLWLGLAV